MGWIRKVSWQELKSNLDNFISLGKTKLGVQGCQGSEVLRLQNPGENWGTE